MNSKLVLDANLKDSKVIGSKYYEKLEGYYCPIPDQVALYVIELRYGMDILCSEKQAETLEKIRSKIKERMQHHLDAFYEQNGYMNLVLYGRKTVNDRIKKELFDLFDCLNQELGDCVVISKDIKLSVEVVNLD